MDRILIKADRTILIDNGFIKDPDGDDENSFVVDCKGSFILPGDCRQVHLLTAFFEAVRSLLFRPTVH